jgi:hypothetical protein
MIDINFGIPNNIVDFIMAIIVWIVMAFITYSLYRKNKGQSPVLWKAIVIILVGLFSFTVNLSMEDVYIKIPILPLGVGLAYLILKRKEGQWELYRSFAWFGFIANFIFLAFNLASIPIDHAIYPKDEPSTFISNIEEATIIEIHPSGKKVTLDKEALLENLDSWEQEQIQSIQWYEEIERGTEPNGRKERFPYQFVAFQAKWGSGLESLVYIEGDGKGILLTTPKQQLYFRSEESVIKEGK